VPNEAGRSPQVIVFTGLPGTGKSTLAESVAMAIRAPAFSADWLMGAIKPSGALASLDRPTFKEMYYRLLRTLITRQLMLGQSAVLDCLVTDAVVSDWREHVQEFDTRLYVIECVCSDGDLHRGRVEGRQRNIPGWHEIDWNHVQRMRAEFPPLSTKQLTLDAVRPLEQNIRSVLTCLAN
jgi:predicted kinase